MAGPINSMVIFHSYISLPEGTIPNSGPPQIGRTIPVAPDMSVCLSSPLISRYTSTMSLSYLGYKLMVDVYLEINGKLKIYGR